MIPVMDGVIQELADEAERGYDMDALRKRGRKPNDATPAKQSVVGFDTYGFSSS